MTIRRRGLSRLARSLASTLRIHAAQQFHVPLHGFPVPAIVQGCADNVLPVRFDRLVDEPAVFQRLRFPKVSKRVLGVRATAARNCWSASSVCPASSSAAP